MSMQRPLYSYQEWVLPKSSRYKQRNFISHLSFRYPHIPEAPGAAESHLTSMWDTALHFHPRDCSSSLASRSGVPIHDLHVGELQPHKMPQEQLELQILRARTCLVTPSIIVQTEHEYFTSEGPRQEQQLSRLPGTQRYSQGLHCPGHILLHHHFYLTKGQVSAHPHTHIQNNK